MWFVIVTCYVPVSSRLFTINTVFIVLSNSPLTTPSGFPIYGGALDLEFRFTVVFEEDQGNDGAADADLFSEDLFLYAAPDRGLVDTTM